MSIEKRKRERVDFIIDVELKTAHGRLSPLKSRDISMGGIFLITEDILPLNTKGEIIITLTCGKEKLLVKADCKVARIEKDKNIINGMGIIFTNMDTESSINLYNIIKYHRV